MKTVVIGSGAWGTALAIRLCKNGHDVTMWTFEKDLIPEMEATTTGKGCFLAKNPRESTSKTQKNGTEKASEPSIFPHMRASSAPKFPRIYIIHIILSERK